MLFPYLVFNLGFNCNFHCKYCFRNYNDKSILPNMPTEKLKTWLKENATNYSRIAVNGGEPLLYMDAIKELFSCVPKWMDKRIITNGSLLTKDIVDYCNDNNVMVTISHDGKVTKFLRGRDVLEEKLDLIRSIKRLAFTTVISKYNINILENIKYIDYKVNRKDIIHIINNYMDNGEDDPLIKDFDYEMYRKYYTEYLETLVKNKHINIFTDRDELLGTQLLLNGDIVELQTLKRYGSIFDNEETILNNIKPDLEKCNCKYKSICTFKKQLASKHNCKMYQMTIHSKNFYKGDYNENLDKYGC